jgi:hypothetical protein
MTRPRRVVVIGYAAHAMPPTLGQGGNRAIEDARPTTAPTSPRTRRPVCSVRPRSPARPSASGGST